jgi:hypothetical protein
MGNSVDVANLPLGVYFVKINTANAETIRKIIKN